MAAHTPVPPDQGRGPRRPRTGTSGSATWCIQRGGPWGANHLLDSPLGTGCPHAGRNTTCLITARLQGGSQRPQVPPGLGLAAGFAVVFVAWLRGLSFPLPSLSPPLPPPLPPGLGRGPPPLPLPSLPLPPLLPPPLPIPYPPSPHPGHRVTPSLPLRPPRRALRGERALRPLRPRRVQERGHLREPAHRRLPLRVPPRRVREALL